jgi:hypothetical protein
MNKITKINEIKKLIGYAKKFLVPGDEISANIQGYNIDIMCRQVAGYDLRLFFWVDDKIVTMYTFYDEKNKWVEEQDHAEECFGGY